MASRLFSVDKGYCSERAVSKGAEARVTFSCAANGRVMMSGLDEFKPEWSRVGYQQPIMKGRPSVAPPDNSGSLCFGRHKSPLGSIGVAMLPISTWPQVVLPLIIGPLKLLLISQFQRFSLVFSAVGSRFLSNRACPALPR